MNNSDYERILIEREKIVRFLELPEDMKNKELNYRLFIMYQKAKAFLGYIEENDIKIGDSTLVPQIDTNKNIVMENMETIYTNSYNFLRNTCKYLDVDLYGAAINILKEVFTKIISLVESNINIDEVEIDIIKKSVLTSFYIVNEDAYMDFDEFGSEKEKVKELFETHKMDIYDLYKAQNKRYTVIDNLEDEDIISVTYEDFNIIIKKEDSNKESFDKIVNQISNIKK